MDIDEVRELKDQLVEEHAEPEPRAIFESPVIVDSTHTEHHPEIAERDDEGGWWFEKTAYGIGRIVHIPHHAVVREYFAAEDAE